jgi:hypothetical protein
LICVYRAARGLLNPRSQKGTYDLPEATVVLTAVMQRVVDDRQIIEDVPGFVDRIVAQLAIRRFLASVLAIS